MANTTPNFEQQLSNLFNEANDAISHLYAELTIRHAAGKSDKLLWRLNETPIFWISTINAHRIAAYMAISRALDKSSRFNIHRLLKQAEIERNLFSRASLAERKRQGSPSHTLWIPAYVLSAFLPSDATFAYLQKALDKKQTLYEQAVAKVRNKYFAHRVEVEPKIVAELHGGSTVRELCQLALFLREFHDALYELFVNGREPKLRRRKYAIEQMFRRPPTGSAPEQYMVAQAQQVLATMEAAKLQHKIPAAWKRQVSRKK